MDLRKRKNCYALHFCLGVIGLASFCYWMGKCGFGKPTDAILPVEVEKAQIGNTIGSDLQHFGQFELWQYMDARGFVLPIDMPLHELRRAMLANYYKPLFDSVAAKTNITTEVVFAFFIIEATREGIESPMFLATWNPGGVKYRGLYKPYYAYDDCFENGQAVMCAFEHPGNFKNAVTLWSEVLNQERYDACRDKGIDETCKCLQRQGYHRANNYRQRARIAKKYSFYLNLYHAGR